MLVSEKNLATDRTPTASAPLEVVVLFTSVAPTIEALKKAGELASGLGASIKLLVPQVVPYPLSLANPPIPREFNERRFRVLAGRSSIDTNVCIYLCRDKREVLDAALKPKSLIVLGARRTWWPNAERRLANRLKQSGHAVVLAETE